MKKILLSFLFTAFTLNCFAQKDFRPGYILQQTDTVKGWINYRSHKANSSVCQFRSTVKGPVHEYKASEISGYGFTEGMHFRSRVIPETSKALPRGKMHPKAYFLNVLVSGKADLYFTRDISGKNRFFLQKDSVFKELESTEVRIKNEKDGRIYKGNSNQYIGTLSYLLNDCNSLQPTINTTKLAPNTLTKTVKTYNQCIHPDSLYFMQAPKKGVTTFGITLGPVFTNVNLKAWNTTPQELKTINRNSGYSAGVTMNNTLPFLNEKLSLQTELTVVRNNINLEADFNRLQYGATDNTDVITYHLEGTLTRYAIKIPLQLRYTFNFQKLRPYFNSGLILTKNINSSDQGTLSAVYKQQQQSITYRGFYPRPLYGNFTAGTGLLYTLQKDKAVFIELKYAPEGIRSLYDFSSDVSSWMLSTGFRF